MPSIFKTPRPVQASPPSPSKSKRRESSCDPRRRSSTISTAYSKRKEAEPNFRKWYADHNDMLTELIDMEMGWNDRIKSMNVNGGL